MENEDKIIKTEQEIGQAHIVLLNGDRLPVKTLTTHTYYESGRKDCKVEIEKPLGVSGLPEKL